MIRYPGKNGEILTKEESICWDCTNAVPSKDKSIGCEWSIDRKPVPGWMAEETVLDETLRPYKSFCVHECPKFCDRHNNQKEILETADFEGLIESTVRRSIIDYEEMHAELIHAVKAKKIAKSVEIGRSMLEIESWFFDGCCGFITTKTARTILKNIRNFNEDDPESFRVPEDIKERLSEDIQSHMKHYITKKEAAAQVMDAYRKAEYEMSVMFKATPALCKICRVKKEEGHRCRPCKFSWKGKPLE